MASVTLAGSLIVAGLIDAATDPVSDLSNYGFAGTIIAVFAIGVGLIARAYVKSVNEERKGWGQQRIDLIARIDAAEKVRNDAVARADRAADELRQFADVANTRGMEVLQRALQSVAEAQAREKALVEEIDRSRREVERLSRELDRPR